MIMSNNQFLPVSAQDLRERGIDQLDFVYVCGDAYVDHPSFGHAIISRCLEADGFTVGIIPQPDWQSADDFMRLGKPKYGFLVSSGNIDSMVNHYTVNKKIRSTDMYSPGGKAGLRPDRAVIVYCNRIREAYGDIPIIIGGIEASLRRFAHYDYWSNNVRRSVVFDSRADVISYGMGERSIIELARAMRDGIKLSDTDIDGCCYIRKEIDYTKDFILLPSYEEVKEDKYLYANATKIQYEEQDSIRGKCLVQKHGDRYLVQNKPAKFLNEHELDCIYEFPYMNDCHPMYKPLGGVPALNEVKFSIAYNRGCFGACSFCALAVHQGRVVQSRSSQSVIREVKHMTKFPDFKGNIHDVGGPTANFSGPACDKQLTKGTCKDRQCLYPKPCPAIKASHEKYANLLRDIRNVDGVKRVFIRSGIRYDYLMEDKNDKFFQDLCSHYVSGQLRVAPEHISDKVLKCMGKPKRQVYDKFCDKFYQQSKLVGKKQYVVPYLMSSHPASTLNDAIELALYMKKHNIHPEQVQDFYPTPFTKSTCMFYTGIDPNTMEKVYVPKTFEEKQMQRALLQYDKKENRRLVEKALKLAGRLDLIGYGSGCLIRPDTNTKDKIQEEKNENTRRKNGVSENKRGTGNRSSKNERSRRTRRSGGNNSRR